MKTIPCHLVILVPGFLGFRQVGNITYFQTVTRRLTALLERRGMKARVVVLKPLPTSALSERAQDLLEKSYFMYISGRYERVHFIGHSTGGLDIRLAFDPMVKLPKEGRTSVRHRRMREVIRSAMGARVSIATPHRGTPLATPFLMMQGEVVPRAFEIIVGMLGRGTIPAEILCSVFGRSGMDAIKFNTWAQSLTLAGFTPQDFGRVIRYAFSIAVDRRAIKDLTPSQVMKLARKRGDLGADTEHCYSFITRAPRPDPERLQSLRNPVLLTPMYVVYAILWSVTAFFPCRRPFPPLQYGELERLGVKPDEVPGIHDNDGVVPTLSQPWGRVVALVEADHLDVVGHPGIIISGMKFEKRKLGQFLDQLAGCIKAAEGAEVPRRRGD